MPNKNKAAKATGKARWQQRGVLWRREKYTIIARYGRNQRGTSTSELPSVWSATEYELTHGADDVTIIVNRAKPQNESSSATASPKKD